MRRFGFALASAVCLALVPGGCKQEGLVDDGKDGSGGSIGTGWVGTGGLGLDGGGTTAIGTGGNVIHATGGTPGTGGLVGTGGAVVNGGAVGAGGVVGTGGRTGTGTGGRTVIGTGGLARNGGSVGTGGVIATGGALGTGGRPATGGTGGARCGSIAGLVCPKDQFCELPVGTCSKIPDATGTCTPMGSGICPAIYAPVCGCDGVTYPSDCDRQAKGVSKLSDGACKAQTTACPSDIKQLSLPCAEGLICEYGTDPRPSCRSSATCTGGGWSVTLPDCPALPDVTCPATRTEAAGQACTPTDAYCVYDDLICHCTNCIDGPVVRCTGDPTWQCPAPNPDATCPAGIPMLGAACATEGKTCTYSCGDAGGRLCKNGAWYAADGGPCPVSTRRAKKNVAYLDKAQRTRIAAELASFKLATFEYRDPSLAGKRHLGFIIEDAPDSPAVDRERNMVDLYGYASMLVAAVQAQGEEIARLKAEIERLKARPVSK